MHETKSFINIIVKVTQDDLNAELEDKKGQLRDKERELAEKDDEISGLLNELQRMQVCLYDFVNSLATCQMAIMMRHGVVQMMILVHCVLFPSDYNQQCRNSAQHVWRKLYHSGMHVHACTW